MIIKKSTHAKMNNSCIRIIKKRTHAQMNNSSSINSSCKHPRLKEDKCTKCGTRDNGSIPSTPVLSYIDHNLRLSRQERKRIRDRNSRDMLSRKKLHLLLDLDHTLLHCKLVESVNPDDMKYLKDTTYKDAHLVKFPMDGCKDDMVAKLRPGLTSFLEQASSMFDMSIYTMGSREYAHEIANLIDPKKIFFGSVISREDCTRVGHKRLSNVMFHHRQVLVIDDTEIVWEWHPRNLIKIRPYNFFRESRDGYGMSLTELEADESEEQGELSKMLGLLKKVHTEFFNCVEDNLAKQDVRVALEQFQGKRRKFSKGNNSRFCSGLLINKKPTVPFSLFNFGCT